MKKFLLSLIAMSTVFVGNAFAAVTFTASVTNANGTLNTTLTWDSPGASGCTAAGHSAWTGAKAASGTQVMPAITTSGTYTLTLSCVKPGSTTATVGWTNPTANTDGTPLTDLTSLKVLYGTSATALTQVKVVTPPIPPTTVLTGLTPGTWFATVRAVNSTGVESGNGNVATKTIVASSVDNGSVVLTVNPVPENPINVTLQ